jgi:hypothetical protein
MPPSSHDPVSIRIPRRIDASTILVYVLVVGALVAEALLIARLS